MPAGEIVDELPPIRTDTYTVDGELVWGATARITRELLQRLRS